MIAYYDSSMTAMPPTWVVYVTDNRTGESTTRIIASSDGSHLQRHDPVWFAIPTRRVEEEQALLAPSLYQLRLERSLAAIAERARVSRRHPRRVVTRPRPIPSFARRTCSLSSRWMVLQ